MENMDFGATNPSTLTNKTIPGYMVTCVDCGEQFFISRANVSWYMKKNMDIPKRCPSCRAIRKENYGVQQAN